MTDKITKDKLLTASFSQPVALFTSLLLLVLVALLDYVLGVEIGLSIFYLLPVAYARWHAGASWGLAFAGACTLSWLANDWILGGHQYSHPVIPFWNAGIRGGYFAIVSVLLGRMKDDLARQSAISREKTELLAMVSHEFGNHLAVLGMSVKLIQEPSNQTPARLGQLCEMLERTYGILSHAVMNFLNYARMEDGKFALDIRRTELRKLVGESLAALAPLIAKKNIRVQREFPVEIVPLDADPDALLLVMANLIGNAVKYTPANGLVTISLVRPDEEDDGIIVSVADTGIGMSAEDLRGLSTMFHRTKPGERFAKGFGVGLRIVKDILESHETRLEISSEPGRGSCFSFRLRISRETLPPAVGDASTV